MKTPLLDGIRKEAGVTSEVIGSILSSPVAIPGRADWSTRWEKRRRGYG